MSIPAIETRQRIMKMLPALKLLAGLLLAVVTGSPAFAATTIISDTCNVTTDTTGFALNTGVNYGIAPPTTRLTGTAAANLRYLNTADPARSANLYSIDSNRIKVGSGGNSGRFALGANSTTPFNFASALGTGSATPANPIIYDVTVSMANSDSSTPRMSFGFGTIDANNDAWDFGVQLYRAASSDTKSTIGKLIDTGSSGEGDLKKPVLAAIVDVGTEVDFLIRVTDAGAESGANYHSRVQVSRDGGAAWFYDTATDSDLPNGWRFDGTARYFIWDQAQNVGPVTYDSFSVKLGATWTGGATGNNWSSAANWESSLVPAFTDEYLVFGGSTRLTPNMNNNYSVRKLEFGAGAGSFTIGATAGKTLTLNGDIFQNAANAQTLNPPISIAAMRTVITASGNLTIGGAISGDGGITKLGDYTLTLGAVNTYSGNTTVSAGTLLVNGSIAGGAVSVASGGTLGGAGAVGGNVTLQSGGVLAPGASAGTIGTLAINGSRHLTLESGSTTEMEVNRSGASGDSVTGISTLTLGGTLEVANQGAALEPGDAFTLFSALATAGEFAAISPDKPDSNDNLAWDTSYLKHNGILRVHHSPNASDKTVTRGRNMPLKIRLSDLFSSPDEDGDTVVLEQCKPSTKGATITANATYVFYLPASDDNDDFDYVVTDNRGGKRTRKVTISVVDAYGQAQQITVVEGKATVSFAGIPGARYDVQRATDVGFTENLTTVLSTNTPPSGLFLLVEEPGLSQAYYRLKFPGIPAP
jgi:autotransporter-associated beta strand protein